MAAKVLVGCFHFCLMGTSAGDQVGKLFVFGDSFVDTGNTQNPSLPYYSLRSPYGATYPGSPTGRWSNGKVMSDFVAEYFGIPNPVPYTKRDQQNVDLLSTGVNFARGGTGVFDSYAGLPCFGEQIDEFEGLVGGGVYTLDASSDIALVSYAGNDYRVYFERGGSLEGLPDFRQKVIDQLVSDLQRLQQLGLKKVIVSNLQAIGCSPVKTRGDVSQCDDSANAFCVEHNNILQAAVAAVSPPIVLLDNYNAFSTVLKQDTFGNQLKGCCLGSDLSIWCGTVSADGTKEYTLCDDSDHTFWWDNTHPTQAAWEQIVDYHGPSLQQLKT